MGAEPESQMSIISSRIRLSRPSTSSDVQINEALADALCKLITVRLRGKFDDTRWLAYLTFTFKPSGSTRRVRLEIMKQEIEQFYLRLLTRVVRRPRSCSSQDRLPIVIACPDVPIYRKSKIPGSLENSIINDGDHFHAVLAVPPNSRLNESLRKHVKRNPDVYTPRSSRIRSLNIKKIKSRPKITTGYSLKAFRRGVFDMDNILILPRARTEL